ncbi:unnamed protein product [Pleuronectes platessa]|uniref:Uncharacterized protein n=1 Tax=Pleuronectes platessa TaxID=8262 RepID=A0A9N7YC46_PLEPL|nr:unnamed protein product [Pleuronectes platessa]
MRTPGLMGLLSSLTGGGLMGEVQTDSPALLKAECQPGLLAGCGKVNGGGKTSYCVTLERNGEGRPSVSSGLPYPQSKWTRAARGEATDTHRAKPSEHNTEAWTRIQPKRWALDSLLHSQSAAISPLKDRVQVFEMDPRRWL